MKNFSKLVSELQKSELNLIESRKADYDLYVSHLETFSKVTKIELKAICENIVKGTTLKLQSIEDKPRLLLRAKKLGIDATKYRSFSGLKNACAIASSKVGKVLKTGANKGMAKVEPKKEKIENQKASEILNAKNEGIEMIKKDAKFIAFLEYAKKQDFDLNLLRLAIK